ncbi:MAG: ImcF-related family protein [Vibrio sp.]
MSQIWLIWAGSCFALTFLILFFIKFKHRKVVKTQENYRPNAQKKSPEPEQAKSDLSKEIKRHLTKRYHTFWRRKVRILLIVGDEKAIQQFTPELPNKLWLEGNRTLLVYGGNLADKFDETTFTELRKLRRHRPLDGIVHVIAQDQKLSPRVSDNKLRSLEKISQLLRYSAPVWLWQLCDSEWTQIGRPEQAVGISLPFKAEPQDVETQLQSILPQLRQWGVAQVSKSIDWDFLLRLGQHLEQGGSHFWKTQLTPWLSGTQTNVPLRGLMFGLPLSISAPQTLQAASQGADDVDEQALTEQGLSEGNPEFLTYSELFAHQHAYNFTPAWDGVLDDCTQVKGKRVGMPWEQTLAWSIMACLGIWGAGLLASFALNWQQIDSVSAKAHALVENASSSDETLTALHELRNDAGRLQHNIKEGAPWYQRFGLDRSSELLSAMLPWYGVVNNQLIRDPANHLLTAKLNTLVDSAPNSHERSELAKSGYDQLKAWLMMSRADKADGDFFAKTLTQVEPERSGISTGLWQSLAPDLWAFYVTQLHDQPQWQIQTDPTLVSQSRQVLLQQIGRRNAESTLYDNMLKSVSRNFADVSLEDMTNGTDASLLFSSDKTVPGVFTRQAWQKGVQEEIEKAANTRRDEIDWVLSDSRQRVSEELSPEALEARLTERYFTDFASHWLAFLNSVHWKQAQNIADVTDQLTLMSDVRQSPLIALMNTVAWQGQTGQHGEKLSDSIMKSAQNLVGDKQKDAIDQSTTGAHGPLDDTFGPLLTLMGKNAAQTGVTGEDALSLQTYLTRITRVRLRLQQIASAPNPQETMQTLAQTVFQGKSVDLTDTQEYGSLIAASLGQEWTGFGQTVFVQPLSQAWETVLQPSAASLNDRWARSVVDNWHTAFDGRFPFANSKSEVSMPMLAEFIRKDTGRIEQFLTTELNGVLHKEGNKWVPDSAQQQGLTFNPAFLTAVNNLSRLSDILFTDGKQGINFELQGRATPEVMDTELVIDGQKLHYFNQLPQWTFFHWPGDSYKPGTMLTWTSTTSGARLYGDYSGTWGLIRWLEEANTTRLDSSRWMLTFDAPDGSKLQWVLRSQLGEGPLILLNLKGFNLPSKIFTVEPNSRS